MANDDKLTLILVQASQLSLEESFEAFADSVRSVVSAYPREAAHPLMVVYPEMHLYGTPGLPLDAANAKLAAAAQTLSGSLCRNIGELARNLGIWLVPGTICETAPNGGIYNTAAVWNPSGHLVAAYRKICPWRPYEIFVPGTSFTVFDIPQVGRIGLTICYDAWFPEISRQTVYLGADLILNLVRTTTPDRPLELVLAKANAITNQCYVASVNAAAPEGVGQSILVDPEGKVMACTDGDGERSVSATIPLTHAREVRQNGTLGLGRVWQQFRAGDPLVSLPLYEGHINPNIWSVPSRQSS